MTSHYDPTDPHAKGRTSADYKRVMADLTVLSAGRELSYHTDGRPRCSGAFAAAWDAKEAGMVELFQRRDQHGRLEHVARRLKNTLRSKR